MSLINALSWVLGVALPGLSVIVGALHWSLKRILAPHLALHAAMAKDNAVMAKDIKTLKRTDRKIEGRLGRIEDTLKIGE